MTRLFCGQLWTGSYLEPNRKSVLECTGTPPSGRVARGHLSGDDACRGRGRWPGAGRSGGRLPDLYEDLVRALVFALLIAAALYLASRVLDHRRMRDYGFHFGRTWWIELGFE